MSYGALCMITAGLLFAAVGSVVKTASVSLPTEMTVFFRNAFGLLALVPWLFRLGLQNLPTRTWKEHFTRSLWGLLAMYCSFYSIAHMRLADALLLNYTSPFFIPLVAKIWLKEPVPKGMNGILLLGFAGVALILKPGTDLFQPVALVALLTGVLAAIAQVNIRKLAVHEPTIRIVFYFALVSSLLSAPPLARVWQNPTLPVWGLALLLGGLATAAQLFLTKSYSLAPAARVGPFIYSTVVFGGVLDWIFWGQLPDWLSVLGAALVIAAGVLAMGKAAQAEATPT